MTMNLSKQYDYYSNVLTEYVYIYKHRIVQMKCNNYTLNIYVKCIIDMYMYILYANQHCTV